MPCLTAFVLAVCLSAIAIQGALVMTSVQERSQPAELTVVAFPQRASLPENPCDLLTIGQVFAATGLEVIEMWRVPGIDEIIRARDEGRDPGPGSICSYHTRSEFGEMNISIPRQAEQNIARYVLRQF